MATMMQQMTKGSAAASTSRPAAPLRVRSCKVAASRSAAPRQAATGFAGAAVERISMRSVRRAGRALAQRVYAIKDGAPLGDRKLRVAVIGGGPSGACAAETLAKGGVEAFLIERKLDNCKVGRRGFTSVATTAGAACYNGQRAEHTQHALALKWQIACSMSPPGPRGQVWRASATHMVDHLHAAHTVT